MGSQKSQSWQSEWITTEVSLHLVWKSPSPSIWLQLALVHSFYGWAVFPCECGGLLTKSCQTPVTAWTVAWQAPLFMEFFRQEHWSGLPLCVCVWHIHHMIYIWHAAKSLQSCPTLCDPIDSSHQAPLSLGFSRQEHWSGLPFPSPNYTASKAIRPNQKMDRRPRKTFPQRRHRWPIGTWKDAQHH